MLRAGFSFPNELSDWLSWLDALTFDLGSFIFPSWVCVGGLTTRLAFNGLWPLLLIFAVTLALLGRAVVRKGDRLSVIMGSLEVGVVDQISQAF